MLVLFLLTFALLHYATFVSVKAMQWSLHQFLHQREDQVANLGHCVLRSASVKLADERLTHLGHKLAVDLHDLD